MAETPLAQAVRLSDGSGTRWTSPFRRLLTPPETIPHCTSWRCRRPAIPPVGFRAEGAIMAPGAAAAAALGDERLIAARRPAVCGFTGERASEPDVFSLHENLWPGDIPPDPVTPSRAPQGGRPTWPVPGSGSGRRTGVACRACPPRPGLARRCRTARRPAGRPTGPPPPLSGAERAFPQG